MNKLTVHTDLDTVSDVYAFLEEIGLAQMLFGEKLNVNPKYLFDRLFARKGLKEFVSIVTRTELNALPLLEASDVIGVISDFFSNTIAAWGGLASMFGGTNQPAQTAASAL